jgi:hypothetical protein
MALDFFFYVVVDSLLFAPTAFHMIKYDLTQVPHPPLLSSYTTTQAKFNRSRPESSVASREDKMKSPLGTQNIGQGAGPGSALGMTPGSGIFQQMETAVLDLAAPWGKETFKVNLILYDKDRALCTALETAIWVRWGATMLLILLLLQYLKNSSIEIVYI